MTEKEPKFNLKAKLSEEKVKEIIKKFKEEGKEIEADEEHFIIRQEKDGKKVETHLPKWKDIDLKSGDSEKIEDAISRVFEEKEENKN